MHIKEAPPKVASFSQTIPSKHLFSSLIIITMQSSQALTHILFVASLILVILGPMLASADDQWHCQCQNESPKSTTQCCQEFGYPSFMQYEECYFAKYDGSREGFISCCGGDELGGCSD